ncbi:MAG: HypC/HybG/HupF family hydrogenase formation chaperone [Gaiellaceae bacterium]|jgi:hydrogenase maturation factor
MNDDARFHCVTCSDEAVPHRVVEVRDDGTARCEGDIDVMIDLVDGVAPGETLLVHAGVALERIPR